MAAKRIPRLRNLIKAASGGAPYKEDSKKIIRFVRMGCTNRPFYHIVVAEQHTNQHMPVIEQVGTYDPLPNEKNQKLVAFNFERVQHWLARGVNLTYPVAELLGLAGYLPLHPRTVMTAWRNRLRAKKEASEEKKE
ncbi:small ribosomal subunit protein bS16m [Neocloeon triangulifer]|uniref:small ribosomal subunit protein bS16m n=1 Tax=Neocloeon triangulifer TaxID=2078957 RepID=UPI00286F9DBC|nr:small ribosomal subunit protein bS16m [Neocloeon triangulifer]